MAARALQAAGVPCCVIDRPAANGAACSERTLEPLICSDPQVDFMLNLVHVCSESSSLVEQSRL